MSRMLTAHGFKACLAAISILSLTLLAYSKAFLPAYTIHGSTITTANSGLSRFDSTAANATLGFQKIIAVSKGPSWRTRGLLAAASLTGLLIEVPPQPHNSPAFLEAFEKSGSTDTSAISHGSARAWIAHIDIIKYIVASNFESALIIEDDLDWDLDIRRQSALLSESIRTLTNTSHLLYGPYGNQWDVLWMGHCGDQVNPNANESVRYIDPTRITTRKYAGWSALWLYHLEPQERIVQSTLQPVCTFAYAVTRQGAQKVLDRLTAGPGEAFDVALGVQCRSDTLRCLMVKPELMHHYIPPSSSGYVSEVKEGDTSRHSVEESSFEDVMGSTPNLVHSSRCEALFGMSCPATPSYLAQPNFPHLKVFEDDWNRGGLAS